MATIDPMVFAAAAVLIITALGGAIVAVIKQAQAVKLMEDVKQGQVEIKTGNKDIHDLVNSASSKTAERVAALEGTIVGLHAAMAALQAMRVADAQHHTAQAQAAQSPVVQSVQAPPVVTKQVVETQVVESQTIKKDKS